MTSYKQEIEKSCYSSALEFLKANKSSDRNKLKEECKKYVVSNYEGSKYGIPSIVFWFILKTIVYFLVEKIFTERLDETTN